jgi:hypothetical protein
MTADVLSKLIGISCWEVEETLDSLHAVLDHSDGKSFWPIRILHTSFRDFLMDSNGCVYKDFQIIGDEAEKVLFKHCTKIMWEGLSMDMCALRFPGALAKVIDPIYLKTCLPEQLQYACRYWFVHLQRSNIILEHEIRRYDAFINSTCENNNFEDVPDVLRAHKFLLRHFLHWLEALSLVGKTFEGVIVIKNYYSLLTVSHTHISHYNYSPRTM